MLLEVGLVISLGEARLLTRRGLREHSRVLKMFSVSMFIQVHACVYFTGYKLDFNFLLT